MEIVVGRQYVYHFEPRDTVTVLSVDEHSVAYESPDGLASAPVHMFKRIFDEKEI